MAAEATLAASFDEIDVLILAQIDARRIGAPSIGVGAMQVDWTDRYPAIADAAAKLRARSFTLDGEAVVCGPDGVAVFDALHRREHDRHGEREEHHRLQQPDAMDRQCGEGDRRYRLFRRPASKDWSSSRGSDTIQ
jgi:hypothetical protein